MADWAAVRMLRRHRQWAILITAAVGLLVAAGAITLTVVENVSKGPAYQKAADYVRSGRGSGLTRMQLGAVLGFGLAVTGPISENGNSGRADLSFVLPVTASAYVLVALGGHFLLRDHISWERWTGIVLITVGVILAEETPARTTKGPPESLL